MAARQRSPRGERSKERRQQSKRATKAATGTSTKTAVEISSTSQDLIKRKAEEVIKGFRFGDTRDRFLVIDKAVQLEEDVVNRKRTDGYSKDTRPPVVKPEIDTAHAFFVDLFASGDPMFKVIETNSNADGAKMMQAQVTSDELYFGYPRQVSMFLRDLVKYNLGALEVVWAKEEIFQPMNDLTFAVDGDDAGSNLYDGNRIRRVDQYNMFWDSTVAPNDVSKRGMYVGYIDRVGVHELHDHIADLIAAGSVVMNITDELWQSTPAEPNYYEPDISIPLGTTGHGQDWTSMFFPDDVTNSASGKKAVNYKAHYELTTMYMRIIPSMWGINEVQSKDRVQIWKFQIVNNMYVILAERQSNAHNNLPILLAQLDDEGVGTDNKSMAEFLLPYQNQATQMNDAWLGMVWKAVGDKGLYDSRRIAKRDIESSNPRAKIPVRPMANNSDIRAAYLPMSFDGNAGSLMMSAISQIRGQATELTGQNNAQKGQFQKGNKTMYEYQDVMSNSDSRKYVQAILLENVVFQPLKTIMKLNILQFATAGTKMNTGQPVDINPATMRQQVAEFRIADGLKNSERITKNGEALKYIQLMAPYAQMAPAYGIDPFAMILNSMRAAGLDTEEYKPGLTQPQMLPQGGNAQGTDGGGDV